MILLTGQNIFYTYIAPFSIETAGLPADAVPGLLLLYGVAGAVGLVLAGVFGGRHPFVAATSFMIVSAVSVLLIWLLPTVVPVFVAVVVPVGCRHRGAARAAADPDDARRITPHPRSRRGRPDDQLQLRHRSRVR